MAGPGLYANIHAKRKRGGKMRKKGEKIPASKLKAAAKKKGKMGQRARLAITLNKLRKKK